MQFSISIRFRLNPYVLTPMFCFLFFTFVLCDSVFSDDHYIGGPVDVWALGVLLYFMVIGNMPFRAPTVPSLRSAVLKGDFCLPALLSLPCLRLIRKCAIFTHPLAHRIIYNNSIYRTYSSTCAIPTANNRPNFNQPMDKPSEYHIGKCTGAADKANRNEKSALVGTGTVAPQKCRR